MLARVWTVRLVTFIVERLEAPVTFRDAPKRVEAFRVATLARVLTVRLVILAVAAFRVVTLVVDRFEVPVTFKFCPKIEDPLRVVTLVLARLDAPSTFAVPVRNRLPELRAFEAYTFPITWRLADTAAVPIPTFER